MARADPRPTICVGAVVVGPQGIVLVKRAQPPLFGEWTLPGGKVELGETLVQAVAREVREETDLDVRVGPIVEVLDRIHRAADGTIEFHYVLVDFVCVASGGALLAATDAADVCWARASQIQDLRVRPDAVAVIEKALALASQVF